MKKQQLNLKDLKPAEYNPREIADSNREGLENSITKFGDIAGITFNVQTGRLVTGHQRVSVFTGLDDSSDIKIDIGEFKSEPTSKGTVATGYIYVEDEPYHLRVVDWDEKTEKLANLEANNEFIQGEFITEKLAEVFEGFRQEELEPLRLDKIMPVINEEPEVLDGEDEAVEGAKPKYEVEEGDIYKLGEHIVICGDSTKKEVYEKLLGKDKADLVFTDPPYNVDYKSPSGSGYSKGKYAHDGGIFNDNKEDEEFFEFLSDLDLNLYEFSKDSATMFMWYAHKNHDLFRKSAEGAMWKYMQNIIWIKERFVLAFGTLFHRAYEPCLVFVKDFKDYKYNKRQTNVDDVWNKPELNKAEDFDAWFVSRDMTDDYVHPTQKPTRLAVNALRRCTEEGDIVLDAFGGSGSTLLACEQMNRKCRMIELDPFYVSRIIERWESFTGNKHEKYEAGS